MASISVCADAAPADAIPAVIIAAASMLLTNFFISKKFTVKALLHHIRYSMLPGLLNRTWNQKKSILQLKTESDPGADQVICKSSITLHMSAGISGSAFV